ncbi:MAG: hypothetical protein R3F46_02970 [bacterium]
MNAYEQQQQAGGWSRAWNHRLGRIDEMILDFTRRQGVICNAGLRRLTDELRLWFDQEVPHLGYDPDWQRVKCDGRILQRLVEERIAHLLHEDRLCVSVVESPVVEE